MEFVIAFEQGLPPLGLLAVWMQEKHTFEIDSAVDFSMVNNIDTEHNSYLALHTTSAISV